MKVYLDYAATGPIKPQVKKAIESFFDEDFGNPSSIHSWGRVARYAVDSSREKIAKFLEGTLKKGKTEISGRVIFTSGGTEADNLAILGSLKGVKSDQKPHIITSQLEHHAIINTCKQLEKINEAEVTYIKPNNEGIIEVFEIEKAIKPNTVLISVMYINNEIGTIQPIREIGKMVEAVNEKRIKDCLKKIYFHTDAVQATEYLEMDVEYLHVDLLTISGHKIGAPKGIGALYIKKGVVVKNNVFGGEQEFGLRPGTENVIGIVALGKAVEILQEKSDEVNKKVIELRDYFINRVIDEIPEVVLNGSKELRSPNNANFYFKYIEGESILLNLDLAGIAASSGSACASHALEPSHVLMAVYDNAERAHGSIRFTLSEETTKDQIDYTIEKIKDIVQRLRNLSPLAPKSLKTI